MEGERKSSCVSVHTEGDVEAVWRELSASRKPPPLESRQLSVESPLLNPRGALILPPGTPFESSTRGTLVWGHPQASNPPPALRFPSHASIASATQSECKLRRLTVTRDTVQARAPYGASPKIELAAMYIQDAMECQPIKPYRDKPGPQRSNRIRHLLYYPRWLAVLALIVLSFIEVPRWCRGDQRCSDLGYYPTWQLGILSWRVSQLYEATCLMVLAVDLALWYHVLGYRQFLHWNTRLVHSFVLLVSGLDLLINLFMTAGTFRLSPYFRIAFLVLYSPSLRRELKFLCKTFPEVAKVLLMMFIHGIGYAWLGVAIFTHDSPEGNKYFNAVGPSLWNLQVLLTTNNYPDILIPAYEQNRLYFFFFLAYIVIGLFFFLNLLTGVVYIRYLEAKAADEKGMVRHREEAVDAAFNCLAVEKDNFTGERCISENVMKQLYKALNRNFHVRYIAQPEMSIMFGLLDRGGSSLITKEEFRALPGLLNCELARVDVVFVEQCCPRIWSTSWFKVVRSIVTSVPNIPAVHVNIPYPYPTFLSPPGVSVKVVLPLEKLRNVIFRFEEMPSVAKLGNNVVALGEVLSSDFCLSSLVIFDEYEKCWVPLVADFQLFDTCQVFARCTQDENAVPPKPLPRAISVKETCSSVEKQEETLQDESTPLLPKLTQVPEEREWIRWKKLTFLPPTSSYLDLAIDVVVLLNGVLVFIEMWPYLTNDVETPNRYEWRAVLDLVFTFCFTFELCVKLSVFGVKRYWKSYQNRFDAFITVSSLVAALVILLPNGYESPRALKLIVMARILRVVRAASLFSWFSLPIATFVNALPSAKKVALLLFSIMFAFVTLGMDLFGGVINKDPQSDYFQRLQGSAYAEGGWYTLNFNDMSSGFVMLFACLVMNNWDNYVQGYELTTSKWSRVYFSCFWILGGLVVCNTVVSLLVDQFNEQWSQAKKKKELRRDPSDEQFKTKAEFLEAGYTYGDWLTAEPYELAGGEAWIGNEGWVFDAQDITGTTTGESGQYLLRYGANDLGMMGTDGHLVRGDSFIKSRFAVANE